jgi:putative ABC transport system permease protein
MSSRTFDLVWEGLLHVARHPTRSLLTALTSAIAIAVTVNVISLSFGFEEDIKGTVTQFGRRTVDVSRLPVLIPGGARPQLGPAEAERVRGLVAGLGALVIPRRQVGASVRVPGGEARTMQVVGAGPDYLRTLNIGIEAGRWLRAGENDACALDRATALRLFPERSADACLGATIEVDIDGTPRPLRVVGVLRDPVALRELFDAFDEGAGARTLTSSLLSFRNVYVAEDTVPGEEFTGISVVLPDDASVERARERLLTVWTLDASNPLALARGGVGVFVRKDWMDAMGATTSTGTLLGNIVWLIVVLVAAVMISTLNLITVRERYDEVALRRCEGARRRDIALQITAEGVVLSLLGGLAGLPIGYLGARLLRNIVDFPFRFELRYAVVATAIAVVLGLISSVLPARHAAQLQPARVLGRRLR